MSRPIDTDADTRFIAEALPAFISEAREQIEGIEQLLLQLETAPDDRDLLDALFRCAHTVKGSAGLFGLDAVVEFTHHVETLLDRLREGHLLLTPALSTLLLGCNDQIRGLVDAAAGQGEDDRADARAVLVEQLRTAAGEGADAPGRAVVAAPAGDAAAPGAVSAATRWRVSVAFGPETFRNGMDPLAILAYLAGLGRVVSAECRSSRVPALDQLEPETCHLAFELEFEAAAGVGRADLEHAFAFVRDEIELDLRALDAAEADAPPAAPVPRESCAPAASAPAAPNRGDAGDGPESARGADGGTTSRSARPREGTPADDATRYIRVQADRLDDVINLLGELVIAGAGAALLARQTGQNTLIEANAQIGRLVEEIRNGTLQLRMVPIGETFARFRRVVRDTASQLGKDVALELVGGETELDKSMVERIADPLMHLVRNALDHGLESPEDRAAAGKPARGRLVLAACHESGSVLIRITDDGRGIDRRKVLARAWDRGLLERGVVPSDEEICALIFEPGFSTAEQVTNLSGRGVGMDVVKRNIEALRGHVVLRSVEGEGTTVEIRLPLTLAIIDGFLIGVGPSRFVLPLETVVEVIESRIGPASFDARGRGLVELRGQPLPIVGLRALYALESLHPERSSIVVLQAAGRRFGVVVDQLLGQHQTVIKPLGRMFRSLRGMSGSTILGNGEVALIIDVGALGDLAASADERATPRAPRPTSAERDVTAPLRS
ncbi:MAG: chemotaxis protein CheA [Burkholderiales bacterium]